MVQSLGFQQLMATYVTSIIIAVIITITGSLLATSLSTTIISAVYTTEVSEGLLTMKLGYKDPTSLK